MVTSSKSKAKRGDYTKTPFRLDFTWFWMKRLDKNTIGLRSKRVYTIAGSMASHGRKMPTVYFSRRKLLLKDFRSYLGHFNGAMPPVAFKQIDEQCEVGVGVLADMRYQQIYFAHSIVTTQNGGQVN